MNKLFRLCAALCLIAGVSIFSVACGDDNNNGNGNDCASDEEFVSIDTGSGPVEACYQVCSSDSDCTTNPDATCSSGYCVETGTTDGDAGNNDTGDDDTGGGLNCADDEVEANPLGEGAACYATCTDDSTCTGAETCEALGDGTQICLELPTGNATCTDILNCTSSCAQNDNQCFNDCFYDGTADAQDAFVAINECYSENNCQDGECFRANCQAEIDTCAGCTGDEVEVNFECLVPCTDDSSCTETGESCQAGYFLEGQESYCDIDMSDLGDACAGDGDCPATDLPQGSGFCITEAQQPDFVGGYCVAAPCQLAPGNQFNYGPSTGCGLQAICIPQTQSGQTIGLCLPLCQSADECRSGTDVDQYTCSIFSKDETTGAVVGTCDPACSTDADCASQDGSTQGRCNDKGYCESPCDGSGTCDQQGGTCVDVDGTEYCQFETAN